MSLLRQSTPSPSNDNDPSSENDPSNENDPEELLPEGDAEDERITETVKVGIDDEGAVFRVNDGGSNLTDRFKYKVHALMGDYDPPNETDDTENETGHILNAMLEFPVTYSFNVVGRTSGDEAKKDIFVEQVKAAVTSISGPDGMSLRITPRGKSFTKVVIQANVESAVMITNIYKELEQLEMSVMQF
jgi:putative lipoic acid-binding regulatory protein